MNSIRVKFKNTFEYIKLLESAYNYYKSRNVKLTNGLQDLKSQLIDGGTKEDSVVILSIESLLNK